MILVVLIVSLIVGVSFPSVASGMDSIRMRSAADAVASFMSAAATAVERREEPLEIVFSLTAGSIEVNGLMGKYQRAMVLPEGVRIVSVQPEPQGEQSPTRTIVVFPGATMPQITLVLENQKGARRTVELDPVTGTARVAAPAS